MSIDDEIMQEFLVEAGELYDLLNDQLTELENNPEDSDLLNAIFRAFHTIKGGAGFMKLTPMVEVCHRAEDVFDRLRNGSIKVDSGLVGVIFQVLDVLGDMFDSVRENEEQQPAEAALLAELDAYLSPAKQPVAEEQPVEVVEESPVSMDDEFEQMISNAVADKPADDKAGQSELITDDEFEDLLDNIHGKGKHKAVETSETAEAKAESTSPAGNSDLITDDEFEDMLDQMHGKDKGPGSQTDEPVEDPVKLAAVAAPVAKSIEAPIDSPKEEAKTEKTANKSSDKKSLVKKESSVRVDTERLDDIMNLVGELVLVRNRLSMLKESINEIQVEDAISTLELVTSDLQSSVMKTRMQPIKKAFSRFPRVIRDLARKLDKDINLELNGEETDLDKSLVEALVDPLIHLVRNSADHGIESPEERYLAGKSRQGTVTLSAKQEGDQVLITVTDDGKGMDHKVFRRKAVESGMLNEDSANDLTDKEAFNLIFAPGFSTKTEISDVSGRGVGMDVVKTRINELNGDVEIDSTFGEGSVITIHLPLTMAILPTLMVMLDRYQFALPLSNVYEAFNMDRGKINVVDEQQVMRVRDEALPLFYLRPWLVRNDNFDGDAEGHKVIVVQMGGTRFCLVVDRIVGQEEVVIKPLGTMLNATPGFSGATITGDGSIALVLDMPSLMGAYASNGAGF